MYSSYNCSNTEITSSSYVSVRSTGLYLPDDGYVLITASVCMGNTDSTNYVYSRVALGVDALTPLDNIEAEQDLPPFGGGDNFMSVCRTQMTFLSAGYHSFHLLIRKQSGTGLCLYFDPTIAAIYIDRGQTGYSVLPDVSSDGSGGRETGNIKR